MPWLSCTITQIPTNSETSLIAASTLSFTTPWLACFGTFVVNLSMPLHNRKSHNIWPAYCIVSEPLYCTLSKTNLFLLCHIHQTMKQQISKSSSLHLSVTKLHNDRKGLPGKSCKMGHSRMQYILSYFTVPEKKAWILTNITTAQEWTIHGNPSLR